MSNDYKDLIAQFQAKGGQIKKVAEGERTMTERQMYRATGYEPDKLYKYEVSIVGEDGQSFMIHAQGSSKKDCEDRVKVQYPESFIESVEHVGTRDMNIYHQVLRDEEQGL